MKKFNRGFTVAEVATAMTIVGVIAAITIPMLHKSIQKHTYAATLARTAEQIELGCQNLLEFENSKRTDGSVITMLSEVEGDLTQKLIPFIGLKEAEAETTVPTYRNYAYIPTYNLGAPVYAAVINDLHSDEQKINTRFEQDICSKTLDGNEICVGGGGGGGGSTPSTPSTPEPEPEPETPTPILPQPDPKPLPPIDPPKPPVPGPDPIPPIPEPEPEPDPVDPNEKTDVNKVYRSTTGKQDIVLLNKYNAQEARDTLYDFVIDTNGSKANPNMYGKDVFKFKIQNNGKVRPFGKTEDCKIGNIGDGQACAARVVADGWKIKY